MIEMKWSRRSLMVIYWAETAAMLLLSLLSLVFFFVGIAGVYRILFVVIPVLIICWIYLNKSIPRLGEEERRPIEVMGAYIWNIGPGPHWVPALTCKDADKLTIAEQFLMLFEGAKATWIDFIDGSAQPVKAMVYFRMLKKTRDDQGPDSAPYKMTYGVTDLKGALEGLMENAMRSYLNGYTIQEGIQKGGAGYDLMDGIKTHTDPKVSAQKDKIDKASEEWGIEIVRLTVADFDLSEETKNAREAVHRAMQELLAMKFHVKQRSGEIAGIIIKAMAQATGKKEKEVQDEIDSNKEIKAQTMGFIQEMISRDWSLEKNALTDIRVSGGGGPIAETLLQLIAVFQRFSRKDKKSSPEDEE